MTRRSRYGGMNKMEKKGKNMSLQDVGTAQADVAGGKEKNSLYARWGWLAGPLVIAALCGFCGRTGTDLYAGASATFGS